MKQFTVSYIVNSMLLQKNEMNIDMFLNTSTA